MGQDSWNLMYGRSHPPKTRRGTEVSARADEGYGGAKMIPGYGGTYQNEKTKVIGKRKVHTPPDMPKRGKTASHGYRSAQESFMSPQPFPNKRK